jgi:hypothetical protein
MTTPICMHMMNWRQPAARLTTDSGPICTRWNNTAEARATNNLQPGRPAGVGWCHRGKPPLWGRRQRMASPMIGESRKWRGNQTTIDWSGYRLLRLTYCRFIFLFISPIWSIASPSVSSCWCMGLSGLTGGQDLWLVRRQFGTLDQNRMNKSYRSDVAAWGWSLQTLNAF